MSLSQLHQSAAESAEITLQGLLQEANEIQRAAMEAKQYAAANGALKLKAELSGLYVQRKEDVTPRDLRSKLTPSYVNCLPADTRRKVAELLAERRSLEVRNQAIESLIAFTEYTFPKYRTAAFHRTIAGQLERVERGESRSPDVAVTASARQIRAGIQALSGMAAGTKPRQAIHFGFSHGGIGF